MATRATIPYVASSSLDADPVTLTLLRDPVARTISYLKHCKRYHDQHRDLSLEEIYDDPFFFRCFIHNHQTKIFAMTTDDKLESYMDVSRSTSGGSDRQGEPRPGRRRRGARAVRRVRR